MNRPWLAPVAAALSLAAVAAIVADRADAIPAFARRYSLSCSVCHAPFPRLNAFGTSFADRGFRMPSAEAEPAEATKETGDPELQLPATVPLAIRMDGHGAWHEDAAAEADVETPWSFKLLSGGPISPRISYYAYFILEKGDVEGLEDAYLHFHRPFDLDVDLLFGQFQICDPLFKRELRLERADYEIYRVRVGSARANLTYDRGLLLATTLPGEIDAVLQVVNGNGIPKGEFDGDTHKSLALRLARDLGPVRVGLFGYRGDEDDETGRVTDRITYLGPDLSISPGGSWELNAQYLERRDDDPWFAGTAAAEVETRGGFAELLWFPAGQQGKWAIAALYNRIDSDDAAAEREDAAIALNYLLARNVRLLAEVGHDVSREESRASLGIVTAF